MTGLGLPQLHFGTSTLLLATAFAAVCIGGTLPFWRALTPRDWDNVAPFFGTLLPLLIPCVFVGVVVGRRALTLRTVLAFAISEAIAAGIFLWLVPH
jgi:hypothetical protein